MILHFAPERILKLNFAYRRAALSLIDCNIVLTDLCVYCNYIIIVRNVG